MPPVNVSSEITATASQAASLTMFGYVYKTTNHLNGMIYVGKREGEFDPSYFGSGTILIPTIKKYGKHNFSVKLLLTCFSLKDLNDTEKRMISLHRRLLGTNKLYNIADGGEGNPKSMLGRHHREESKRVIGRANKGKIHSRESVERQKKSFKGYVTSEETKEKLRAAARASWTSERLESVKGRIPWNKGTGISHLRNTAPKTGRHKSEEQKKKMSESRRKQAPPSEELKSRISLSLKMRSFLTKISKSLTEVNPSQLY